MDNTITMLIWLTVICLIIQFVDGRRCVIPFHWWRPFRNMKTVAGNLTRLIAAGASIALLCSFTWTLSIPGAWGYEWAQSWEILPSFGIRPRMRKSTVRRLTSCGSPTRKSWISRKGIAGNDGNAGEEIWYDGFQHE